MSPGRLLIRHCFLLTLVISLSTAGFSYGNDRALSQQIDELVERNYRQHGIKPNPKASEEVFVRRAYLDIIGRVPTPAEAQQFLRAESSNRRSQLISYLLKSDGHVSHAFNFWADILRVKSRMEGESGEAYAAWVKEALKTNKPYNQLVHELITAEGYVWDNGAVGYYMRDADMPLDNMSNTTQVFLGTQLVCAQCHNHPFDKWKQKDYYEMAAYTYGMDTRINPSEVLNVDEKMSKMEKRAERRKSKDRDKAQQVRRAVRDLLEPLSYKVTHNEEKKLKLPDDYQYDDAKPNEEVSASTIFGNSVSGRSRKKLQAYADWMTSPENPRFARVIANRLWKRVMGVGLVEPVDDFRDDTRASNPDLMAFLERTMIDVGYDMRRFLSILYNTRTYQRQSTTDDINLDDYHFPGPALKRMTGEQIWDSILTSIIPAPDERKKSEKYLERYEGMKRRAEGLESMRKQPQVILDTAKKIADVEYEHEQKTKDLRAQIAKAREQGNDALAKTLTKDMREANNSRDKLVDEIKRTFEAGFGGSDDAAMMTMMDDATKPKKSKKTVYEDMRWKGFSDDYVRASELRSPAPTEHFLRQFGQSDRETIEAAHTEASVSQVLNLLNGNIYDQLIKSRSVLWQGITQLYDAEEKQDFIFQSLLTRLPTDEERAAMNAQFANAKDVDEACKGVIWALLNTQELLFVQ